MMFVSYHDYYFKVNLNNFINYYLEKVLLANGKDNIGCSIIKTKIWWPFYYLFQGLIHVPNAHMGKWNYGSAQTFEKFVHEARSIARLGLASTEAKAKGQRLRPVLQVGLEGLCESESESWSQAMCSFSLRAVDTPNFLHLMLLFHAQLRLHQST